MQAGILTQNGGDWSSSNVRKAIDIALADGLPLIAERPLRHKAWLKWKKEMRDIEQ